MCINNATFLILKDSDKTEINRKSVQEMTTTMSSGEFGSPFWHLHLNSFLLKSVILLSVIHWNMYLVQIQNVAR
jgi:hypothetical protein